MGPAWNETPCPPMSLPGILPPPRFRSFCRPVDLIEQCAAGEERRMRLHPAAEGLVDSEERERRQFRAVFLQGIDIARPVMKLRPGLLCFGGIEKFQIGFREIPRAFFVDHFVDDGYRRLAENAARRIDDFELVLAELVEREPELVLP